MLLPSTQPIITIIEIDLSIHVHLSNEIRSLDFRWAVVTSTRCRVSSSLPWPLLPLLATAHDIFQLFRRGRNSNAAPVHIRPVYFLRSMCAAAVFFHSRRSFPFVCVSKKFCRCRSFGMCRMLWNIFSWANSNRCQINVNWLFSTMSILFAHRVYAAYVLLVGLSAWIEWNCIADSAGHR